MQQSKPPRSWSIQCIVDWLHIREKQGHEFPASVKEFEKEIDHSGLLHRLLEGRGPLPDPPPLSFGYPWYSLIDEGGSEIRDVWEADAMAQKVVGAPALFINQFPWSILEKQKDVYIVTYGNKNTKWKVEINSIGAGAMGLAKKNWKITKI